MEDHFKQFMKLAHKVSELNTEKQYDEADKLRDEMYYHWYQLTPQEQEKASTLHKELYGNA